MAITDLTNTTWIINKTPRSNMTGGYASFALDFYSGNNFEERFKAIQISWRSADNVVNKIQYVLFNGNRIEAYTDGKWININQYKQIYIVGGDAVKSNNAIGLFTYENFAQKTENPILQEKYLSKTGLSKVWQNILTYLNKKQEKLVSGVNVKTVNNESLLGRGNLDIGGGTVDASMSSASKNAVQNKVIKSYVDEKTGDLTALSTIEKTNLVGAVNEVNAKVGFHVAVNQERWVGTYTDENDVVYQVYSKQIYIPALPSTAGITAYEHGIDNIKQILDIYGSTTDGFVLNAPRQTVTDNITIYQASKSASNKTFSIEVGKDRSNKKAYVTVIYAKNN